MHSFISSLVSSFERGTMTRRQLISALTGITAAAGLAPRVASGIETRADDPTFQATALNHVALSVTDVGRARDFYMKHLGLTVASESRFSCFLRCREKNFVALFRSEKAGMNHYCYSIEQYEPGEVVETLKSQELKPRRQGNRVYFDDPDGLEVQLAAKSHGV